MQRGAILVAKTLNRDLLFTGIGLGFGDFISYLSVQIYFDHNIALGNGIMACGYGLGPAIYGPFIGHIVSRYGWRVAVLVLGGITGSFYGACFILKPPPISAEISKDVNINEQVDQHEQQTNRTDSNNSLVTLSTNTSSITVSDENAGVFQNTEQRATNEPQHSDSQPCEHLKHISQTQLPDRIASHEGHTPTDDIITTVIANTKPDENVQKSVNQKRGNTLNSTFTTP